MEFPSVRRPMVLAENDGRSGPFENAATEILDARGTIITVGSEAYVQASPWSLLINA